MGDLELLLTALSMGRGQRQTIRFADPSVPASFSQERAAEVEVFKDMGRNPQASDIICLTKFSIEDDGNYFLRAETYTHRYGAILFLSNPPYLHWKESRALQQTLAFFEKGTALTNDMLRLWMRLQMSDYFETMLQMVHGLYCAVIRPCPRGVGALPRLGCVHKNTLSYDTNYRRFTITAITANQRYNFIVPTVAATVDPGLSVLDFPVLAYCLRNSEQQEEMSDSIFQDTHVPTLRQKFEYVRQNERSVTVVQSIGRAAAARSGSPASTPASTPTPAARPLIAERPAPAQTKPQRPAPGGSPRPAEVPTPARPVPAPARSVPAPTPSKPGEMSPDAYPRVKMLRSVLESGQATLWQGTYLPPRSTEPIQVAVKVFHKKNQFDCYRSELKLLMRLSEPGHPNVVKMYEFYESPSPCLIVKWIDGGDLYRYLAGNRLRPDEVVRLSKQILCGLEYLHNNRIIHRDLKSMNVMVPRGPDGQLNAVIVDLGLALQADLSAKSTLTYADQDGVCAGTFQWMAPESMLHACYSVRSDIYSFGIVLWEMLSGKTPYEGAVGTRRGLEVQILSETNPLRPSLPAIASAPRHLVNLVTRCWSANPEHRPRIDTIVAVLDEQADLADGMSLDQRAKDFGLDDLTASEEPLSVEKFYSTFRRICPDLSHDDFQKVVVALSNQNMIESKLAGDFLTKLLTQPLKDLIAGLPEPDKYKDMTTSSIIKNTLADTDWTVYKWLESIDRGGPLKDLAPRFAEQGVHTRSELYQVSTEVMRDRMKIPIGSRGVIIERIKKEKAMLAVKDAEDFAPPEVHFDSVTDQEIGQQPLPLPPGSVQWTVEEELAPFLSDQRSTRSQAASSSSSSSSSRSGSSRSESRSAHLRTEADDDAEVATFLKGIGLLKYHDQMKEQGLTSMKLLQGVTTADLDELFPSWPTFHMRLLKRSLNK